MTEQRNPYKGRPPRPWVRIELLAPDGTPHHLNLVADTGSPFGLITDSETFERLCYEVTGVVETNYMGD